jgi:hypothetical protein
MHSPDSSSDFQLFKYQTQIEQFKSKCNLSKYHEYEARTSYRWVYADINDERNFSPIYQRFNDGPKSQCTGWALSMYETQQQARDRLEFFTKDKPNAYLRLGTHTAVGVLERADGRSGPARESDAHFDHFEYPDRNLAAKFDIVECVVIIEK